MKTLGRIFVLIVLISALSAAGVALYLRENIPVRGVADVEIPNGATLPATMKILRKNKAIDYPFIFNLCAKTYSAITRKKIVAGYYRYNATTTHLELLNSLFSGKQAITVNVVYPEGISLKDFASISARRIGLDSAEFMRLASSDSLLKARNIPGKSIEGYLMPDTYNFFWKQRPAAVLDRLLDAREKVWSEFAFAVKDAKKNKNEILTMASIIEAETPRDDEKKIIAGLYYNRLKKNMKLEADPTAQFAIGSQKRLTYKDLQYDNPYNTYKYAGLPPGPINSPGKAAIEAAVYPDENDFLFFVAMGDGTGRHTFSKNYADHQKAAELYRKRRNAR